MFFFVVRATPAKPSWPLLDYRVLVLACLSKRVVEDGPRCQVVGSGAWCTVCISSPDRWNSHSVLSTGIVLLYLVSILRFVCLLLSSQVLSDSVPDE